MDFYEYRRNRYYLDREKSIKRAKAWYHKNKEKVKEREKKNKKKKSLYQKQWRKDNLHEIVKRGKINTLSRYCWAKIIRQRDCSCQICGKTRRIEAHHIIHMKDYPQLTLNLNNGITLCFTCHRQAHGYLLNR